MSRTPWALPLSLLALAAASACAGGSQTPVTEGQALPSETPEFLQGNVAAPPMVFGAVWVEIDPKTMTYTIDPVMLRNAQDRGDVLDSIDGTFYLSNPAFCATGDCIEMTGLSTDDLGGTLAVPLITTSWRIKHPFPVPPDPVTGLGGSRKDLNVQNLRGYIVNGGPDSATDVRDTGIPLIPAGVTPRTDSDTDNIRGYFGPLTGGSYPGLAGFVANTEGYNNGSDGVLTTLGGTPVPEAGVDLFDFRSPSGMNSANAHPYLEFIPLGDTGDRVFGQGQSAEATYQFNIAPGAPTIRFLFAVAANWGVSAGNILTDPANLKTELKLGRRAAPVYYRPAFNKPEALSLSLDAANSSDGAETANLPVELYVDIEDMQAGASLPATWAQYYGANDDAAARNLLPPDATIVTERGGKSTYFTLGPTNAAGGGLPGLQGGLAPSLLAYTAPTLGGVQRISWMVFSNATGNVALAWDVLSDIDETKIDPVGVGLPPAGWAYGLGSDADGITPASPLKAHIQIPTGINPGQLAAGSYTVVVVAYDDLIDDGDSVANTLFEESAWNLQLFQVTVAP